MPESRHEVRTILINYYCDDCNLKTSEKDKQPPILIPEANSNAYYRCPLCDKKYVLSRTYPTIEYEYYD